MTQVAEVSPDLERLAFGTQIIAELRGAPSALIGDAATVRATVAALLRFLEGEHEAEDPANHPQPGEYPGIEEIAGASPAGVTIGGSAGDSGAVLHAFPDLKRLALRVYSSRAVRPFEAVAEFRRWYPAGKLELHVSGRYRRIGQSEELRRELAGERSYAGLRLGGPALNGLH